MARSLTTWALSLFVCVPFCSCTSVTGTHEFDVSLLQTSLQLQEASVCPSMFAAVFSARKNTDQRAYVRQMWKDAGNKYDSEFVANFALCKADSEELLEKGKHALIERTLREEQAMNGDMMFLNCEEGYGGGLLTLKALASMSRYSEDFSALELFMKTDDDTFIMPGALCDALKYNSSHEDHFAQLYAGGFAEVFTILQGSCDIVKEGGLVNVRLQDLKQLTGHLLKPLLNLAEHDILNREGVEYVSFHQNHSENVTRLLTSALRSFDHIVFTDKMKTLRGGIIRDPESPYYDPVSKVPDSVYPFTAAGGPGYILGRNLVTAIVKASNDHSVASISNNEDRAVATWVEELQHNGTKVNMVNLPAANGYVTKEWPSPSIESGGIQTYPYALHHKLSGETISCLHSLDAANDGDAPIDRCFPAAQRK